MIYIENIKFVSNTYRDIKIFEEGFSIPCSDINIIVGDQGCGKSTLLKMLHNSHRDLELTLHSSIRDSGIETYYFDSEMGNPRVKNLDSYSNIKGESVGIGIGNALNSRFMSHGEVMVKFTTEALHKAKDCIVLLDEPESGLSLTNQFRLIDSIETAVSNNCQLFIATHCYPIISRFDVISMEEEMTMSGTDFINYIQLNYNK